MIRPVKVEALPHYQLHVVYSDGVDGTIDLSRDVGNGVFTPLVDPAVFAIVHLGKHGQIAWSDEIEICPDAVYLEITGKRAAEAAHA
ncbi:MAG TPA: DUF2442 domain-containing protein [Chthoniobacterales bacterium]|nr:DUF2442 domain-containing protein [Chthoniobacterales bacterium]